MSKNKLKKEIINLSNLFGISSRESEISNYIKNKFSNKYEINFDNLGSFYILKKSKNKNAKKIMIAAHIDEVGFLVTKIDDKGFIYVNNFGKIWEHIFLGQRVVLKTNKNTKIIGVVGSKPPHLLTIEEEQNVLNLNDLYIDIGCSSKEEVNNLGINLGTPLTFDTEAIFQEDIIQGKALDNRVSVGILIYLIEQIEKVELDVDVYFSFTTQEEVGLRGAKTLSYKINPDYAIVLDVTLSNDTPEIAPKETKLNSGVAISLFDRLFISNQTFFDKTIEIAKLKKIKYTVDYLKGGATDSGMIHLSKEGIKTQTILTPCRYFHSKSALFSVNDAYETFNLVKEILKNGNNFFTF